MFIETDRLILTNYQNSDIEKFYKLKSCKEVWEYSTFTPLSDKNMAEGMLKQLVQNANEDKLDFMALREKGNSNFIGEAAIISDNPKVHRCEIAYNLLPEYWNKGYATEIVKSLVEYAIINLKYERIEALALQENKRSCRVLEKSGFTLEGTLRNFNKSQNGYRNVCYYAVISEDII